MTSIVPMKGRHASRVQHGDWLNSAASVHLAVFSPLVATDHRRYQDLIKTSYLGKSDYHPVHVKIDNPSWITALIG